MSITLQDDYIRRKDIAISSTVQAIREAVDNKKDIQPLFFQILGSLGQTRHEIAQVHKVENADHFGIRRDEKVIGFVQYTSLQGGSYDKYNRIILDRLNKEMPNLVTNSQVKISDQALGRKFSFELNFITYDYIEQKSLNRATTVADLPKTDHEIPAGLNDEKKVVFLLEKMEVLDLLKKKKPDIYQRIRLGTGINVSNCLIEHSPDVSQNRAFIIGTSRLEVNGKMYAVSQYVTWLKLTPERKPTENSVMLILHQDIFLHKDMLQDIAKLFEKAVLWNRKDLQELKNYMALFRFTFAHTMPFHRGSAAVSEWLETAIYRFHGFENFHYQKEAMVDLEALTAIRLSDYLEAYDSAINLIDLK